MSADNWARCPRCAFRESRRIDARAAEIAKLYGTVSVDDFDKARTDLEAQRKAFATRDYTFREDYEFFGAEDGSVTASYSGSCTKCGLSLSFEDEHAIAGWDKP
jgi:hypothetical protein